VAFFLSFAVSVLLARAAAPQPSGRVVNGKVWCVANPAVPPDSLQKGLDYACSQVDCSAIQYTGNCVYPDNIHAHASWVYNYYFQMKARYDYNCYFDNTALISSTDPS
ncbi:hypothetical protein SELMODRAFT_38965, partial [Selaginella moellendorffii]